MRALAILSLLGAGLAYFYAPRWLSPGGDGGLVLYGNVDIRELRLGFRVAGRLQSMHFEEGDSVAAGDLLATLDAEPLVQALAVAERGRGAGAGGWNRAGVDIADRRGTSGDGSHAFARFTPAVGVVFRAAQGRKCQRCWKVLPDVGAHAHPDVCGRCDRALAERA